MKKIFFVIKGLIIVLLCVCSIDFIGRIMSSLGEYNDIDNKQEYDVAFVGSSHVYRGINPQLIFDETGITSINLATSSQDLKGSYWLLKRFLRKHHPQAVFIDVYPRETGAREAFILWNYHEYDIQKPIAFYNLKNDEFGINDSVPFLLYRTEYDSIDKSDFDQINGKGVLESDKHYSAMYSQSVTLTPEILREAYAVENDFDSTVAYKYIDKIIELTGRYGVTPVFMKVPYIPTKTEHAFYKELEEYLDQKKVSFFDYSDFEKMGVEPDFSADFADTGHLSYQGGLWFGKELGNCIVNTLGIDHDSNIPLDYSWTKYTKHYENTYKIRNLNPENQEEYLKYVCELPDDYVSIIAFDYEAYNSLSEAEKVIIDNYLDECKVEENEDFVLIKCGDTIECEQDYWGAEVYRNIGDVTFHLRKENETGTYNIGPLTGELSKGFNILVYVKSYNSILAEQTW